MYGQCPLHTCPLTVSTAAVIASGQVGSGGLRLNCTTRPCRACSHASSKASSQPRPISVPSSGCRRPLQRRSGEVAESKAKAYKVNDVTLVNRLHYKGHQRKYICTGIGAMTSSPELTLIVVELDSGILRRRRRHLSLRRARVHIRAQQNIAMLLPVHANHTMESL